MDGYRFDELTRALATNQSRRGVLTRLAQVSAALGLAAMGCARPPQS